MLFYSAETIPFLSDAIPSSQGGVREEMSFLRAKERPPPKKDSRMDSTFRKRKKPRLRRKEMRDSCEDKEKKREKKGKELKKH